MIDLFASEVGIDPVEIRKSNVHAPDAFPLTTPTGARMDCGDYAGSLDRALEAAGYDELRAEQAKRRENGDHKLLGIGLSTYVEITNPTNAGEYGSVEIRPDGTALLLTGQSPHGQGTTTFAQLTSELTGIPVDKIEVRHGDTDEVPRGAGTGGSKAMQLGGTAIWQATESVVERAKEIAAELFEANPSDIVLDTENASFSVAGTRRSPGPGPRSPSVKPRSAGVHSDPRSTSNRREPPSPSARTFRSSRSTPTPAS
ncbi:MAG: molybdopterin cofactor-binding domain-containing protein [Acidimicrobiales bacterium]